MIKFSRQIINIATATVIISVIGLTGTVLSKEGSVLHDFFSNIALYGTMITICVLLLHLLIVFVSFIISLIKRSRQIINIATTTFIISVIGLIGSVLSEEDSALQDAFSTIAIYGIIITICILLLHLLIVLVSFIIRLINRQSDR